MEDGTNDSVPNLTASFSRASSSGSSLRRRSLSLSHTVIDDDIESENVSEAGDIGDRALHSKRHSESSSVRFSLDNALENGLVFPIRDDNLLQSHGMLSHNSTTSNTAFPQQVPEENISPLSTDAMVCSNDQKKVSFLLITYLDFFC